MEYSGCIYYLCRFFFRDIQRLLTGTIESKFTYIVLEKTRRNSLLQHNKISQTIEKTRKKVENSVARKQVSLLSRMYVL